jgi:photosystem II stability/assembly factor-like uncharacterized protein
MNKLAILLICFISIPLFSQQKSTAANSVEEGLAQKQRLIENSIVKNLPFKNIGPTVMSGRVTSLSVNPDNPIEFYVGYASGGVWYTKNNGTSFEPVLDSSPTQNVGCVTMDWKTNTLWVGTGEVNASRSSYAGIGILKSTDEGKTWVNMGLTDSHHISNILINPNNSNEIVVGVVGHLYSKNEERGVYKSTDGGQTWAQTLFVNDQSGIIELEVSPSNFNLMYASSWDKDRKAWNFRGSGNGSGIYKSIDAGSTWAKVSSEGSGLPTGEGVGRIGLAIYNDDVVYAIHDSQFRREKDKEKESSKGGLQKDDFKSMSVADFLSLEDASLKTFLKSNGFPKKYTVDSVKEMVKKEEAKPIDIAKYLEDANSLLFDTPVVGTEIFKSTDGGKNWKKTHEGYLDNVYYSYGYYFGKIHVDPSNQDAVYIYGVPILKSKDGGKKFESMNAGNVHADHHALWINPKKPGHLINGNDGGVNITYDDGKHWIKNNSLAVGQFYAINVDNEKPYNVYGGLQDNGVWVGPHNTKENRRWLQNGEYPYKFIMGGDGMQIQIDNRNSNIVYTGYQFGNYYRLNRETDEQTYIQPKHELGENPYRFNWQTPILLSSHNQDILYLGANKLMRSMDQGTTWDAISEDLTKGGKPGNVSYGTLTTISESTFQFGLMYAGSDDGYVQVTKNGGGNWQRISNSFPQDLWVSRVEASSFKKERVFVTLNGYRWDDFTPYVFVSEDYGATWKNISSNLPTSSVNVIKEDTENENILYLGTDNGVYVSFNRGVSWEAFSSGLTNVATHDLVIQPEAKDLVVGTHGRSIYVANISLLQKMNSGNKDEVLISEIEPVLHSGSWGKKFSSWGEVYQPSVEVHFYSPIEGKATISIQTEEGEELESVKVDAQKGVNVYTYHLTFSNNKELKAKKAENEKYYLPKRVHVMDISIGKKHSKTELKVK